MYGARKPALPTSVDAVSPPTKTNQIEKDKEGLEATAYGKGLDKYMYESAALMLKNQLWNEYLFDQGCTTATEDSEDEVSV